MARQGEGVVEGEGRLADPPLPEEIGMMRLGIAVALTRRQLEGAGVAASGRIGGDAPRDLVAVPFPAVVAVAAAILEAEADAVSSGARRRRAAR